MPVVALTTIAASGAVVGAAVLVTPRLVAGFISKVARLLLADEKLRRDATAAFVETLHGADEELAKIIWSREAQRGLQDALIELFKRPDYHDAVAMLVSKLTRDKTLKDTIREGVLEAFRDGPLKAEAKAVLIEALNDEEMRNALLKAAIQTVKTGIRESVEDTELKEVITVAIRDALEDPRLSGVLRGALKEALADQELHQATLQGAVNALNPFKKVLAKLGVDNENEGALSDLMGKMNVTMPGFASSGAQGSSVDDQSPRISEALGSSPEQAKSRTSSRNRASSVGRLPSSSHDQPPEAPPSTRRFSDLVAKSNRIR